MLQSFLQMLQSLALVGVLQEDGHSKMFNPQDLVTLFLRYVLVDDALKCSESDVVFTDTHLEIRSRQVERRSILNAIQQEIKDVVIELEMMYAMERVFDEVNPAL